MSVAHEVDQQVEIVHDKRGAIRGVRVEQRLAGGWFAVAELRVYDDELVLVEVKVFPGGHRNRYEQRGESERVPLPSPGAWRDDAWLFHDVDEAGLTTRLLRQVRVGELVDAARQAIAAAAGTRHAAAAGALLELPVTRPGRAGRPDDSYLPWAVQYAELVAAGSRAPIRRLAAGSGRTPEAVRDLIHACRTRGLLTRGHKGRPGGQLTDKAKKLLADQGDPKEA